MIKGMTSELVTYVNLFAKLVPGTLCCQVDSTAFFTIAEIFCTWVLIRKDRFNHESNTVAV